GSQVLLEARTIKTPQEIALLDQSAGLVDAVYEEIYRMLRPGVYEHEIVARAHQLLFEMGSEQVEAVNAVSGDRCNPHPHVFPDEETCFGLQFGHGIGVGLYESLMISRVHSLDHPVELQEGMVFALETYCAATDGRSAARIEEEVVVTPTGCEVITRFPAEELLVAGRIYVRGADLVSDGVAGRDGMAGVVAASAVVGDGVGA